jgi:hypothetical protein
MEFRRILLRVLLAALALAALAGVVGVVTAGGHMIWRIVVTAITTAIAVAIMLPFSQMIDKQSSHTGGVAGMIWTTVGYILALGVIWEITSSFSSVERGFGTLLSWIVCGLPAVLLLRYTSMPEMRLASLVGAFLAGCTFCLLMIGVWHREIFGSYDGGTWYRCGIALGTLAVPVVINLVRPEGGRKRWWRWVGVAAACGAYVVAWQGIWENMHSAVGQEVLTFLASLSAVLGLANLVLMVPLSPGQEIVRWGTILAGAICAATANLWVYFDRTSDADLWGRFLAGSGIVTGCGSLALLVLARINRQVEYRPEDGSLVMTDIAVTCPRCSKSQKIKLGGGVCKSCGLRIEITIEEPRCPKCGYLLYMLQSAVCPECGTAIAGESAAASRVQKTPGT